MHRLRTGPLRPPRARLPWNTHTRARAFVSDRGTTLQRTVSSCANGTKDESQPEKERGRGRGRTHRGKGLPRTLSLRVYELPDSVLDLDAENNPHVRAYNDDDAKKQLEYWSRAPHVDALVQRMAGFRQELRAMGKLWASRLHVYDPRRISGRDVLAAALLGPPGKWPRQVQAAATAGSQAAPSQADTAIPSDDGLGPVTSSLLKSIGVSERLASDRHRIVSILLRRLDLQDPQTADENQLSMLKEQIRGKSMWEVKRIVAPLLGTDAGCALVSRCGPEVVQVCTHDSQLRDRAYSNQVSALLKNISINLARRGISREGFVDPTGPELGAILDGWQSS